MSLLLFHVTGIAIFVVGALATETSMPPSNGTMTPAARRVSNAENSLFTMYVLITLLAVALVFTVFRVWLSASRYIRTLANLNNDSQQYFKTPNMLFARFKKHLFYAPLFGTKHSEKLLVSRSWSLGSHPTRLQLLFLTGVIAMNIVLCVVGIEWLYMPHAQAMVHLRHRTGTLTVFNMIPLFVMAGRNNPLIKLCNISFDTFNLLHRWFGSIVVIEIFAHTVVWTVQEVQTEGWVGVQEQVRNATVINTGLIALCVGIFILIQASSIVRHAFYETFLTIHILSVIFILVVTWIHLQDLAEQFYVTVMISFWATERFARVAIIVYRNYGQNGGTEAIIEVLPGDALRITMKMARPWTFKAGQHMFITIPSIGLWTSHPFSVAWSGQTEHLNPEKGLVMTRQDILRNQKPTMSCIVRRRGGFTNTLYKKAAASPEGRIVVSAMAEGPYGAHNTMHSYGTVMLFAGGVGITHQIPYIRDLLIGHANGTVATRRIILIWIIQSVDHLAWIRPWMSEILALDRRRDVLRIQLFITRPRSVKEILSPSETVQMFPGRPNVDTLVGLQTNDRVGAMGVSVCGTGGLADEVRRAVRMRQEVANIDFLEESFSW